MNLLIWIGSLSGGAAVPVVNQYTAVASSLAPRYSAVSSLSPSTGVTSSGQPSTSVKSTR